MLVACCSSSLVAALGASVDFNGSGYGVPDLLVILPVFILSLPFAACCSRLRVVTEGHVHSKLPSNGATAFDATIAAKTLAFAARSAFI